ncbi:PDDEXK nuclease domain-containing protein [Larkinella insperata]|uniref:PDDEXK nuclease domain-containing protein n=1 Tax=Larkinella insperata TaxID=332158 RepID=UPI0036D22A66
MSDIKQRVRQAQYKALQSVNREQVQLYFELGRLIVERQQQHGWGKSVVESLAKDLQTEFAGMTGFSVQNLWYMRQFFLEYSQSELLQPLVGEISWSKHLLIMARCKGEDERLFYIIQTKRNDWTKNVLIHQIEGGAYQRILASQQNFTQTLPKEQQKPAVLAVKDEYTFDFLELANEHSEYELEQALLANIRRFLIEMGGDFTFVGNQYRLELGGQEFFIDLLLFHRQLQCLIAVELKIDEFKPEFAGKMNFYLSVLNDRIKKPHENPSIGIIICKAKQRTIVEFALKDINKPIGVATYTLTPTLPDELSKFFPTNEQLIERVEAVTDALRKK